jgi:outer membrane protein assembly factor BamB
MGAISEDGDIVWEFELSNIHGRLANAPVITASGEVVYTLYGFNLHAIKLH